MIKYICDGCSCDLPKYIEGYNYMFSTKKYCKAPQYDFYQEDWQHKWSRLRVLYFCPQCFAEYSLKETLKTSPSTKESEMGE